VSRQSNDILAVVFDLDDTLYPEMSYAFSGFRAVARRIENEFKPTFDVEARMRSLFDSPNRGQVFNTILQELGITDSASRVDALVRLFREHPPEIELFDDAKYVLNRLAGRYRLGLISDGYLVTQQAKVRALGLESRIDEIILTDQWGRQYWKPHERAYLEMSKRLAVPHDSCVFVGDNRAKDFVAPNRLGWVTVSIDRPGGVYLDASVPPGGAPQHVIESLNALEDTLHSFER